MKEMGHIDHYPYPTYPQAAPSFGIALQIVTNRSDLDRDCKVKTLHTVVSFASGQIFQHDHEPVEMGSSKELDQLAAWATESDVKQMHGINWRAILSKLLPLILELLTDTE